MSRAALLNSILEVLDADLAQASHDAKAAAAAATDPDSKAENKYDTRALESSYLARGQAQRVTEAQEAVRAYGVLAKDLPPASPVVAVGALIELTTPSGNLFYFLGPAAGGTELKYEGREIILITPASPLGRKLIGKTVGDAVEMQPGRPAWRVRAVT